MNEKQQIFEVINGFKNLASKMNMFTACKKEYQKLYFEHEELKKKYAELENYFQQQQQQ